MTEQTLTMPDFRLDHAMIRVKDLDRSLDFYTRILGMKIHRKTEYPEGRFTNTFPPAWAETYYQVELAVLSFSNTNRQFRTCLIFLIKRLIEFNHIAVRVFDEGQNPCSVFHR